MFTNRALNITPSATVELNAEVAELLRSGIDVIKLNIGEPDFNTPEHIKQAAKKAINENFTRYTPVAGIPELRRAISDKLRMENGFDRKPDEICVSTGAKQALANALLVIAQPGDEIIIPTPSWVSYGEMVRITGATPVLTPTSSQPDTCYELDIPAIEKAVTERTKGIIINTPNNPTGAVYDKASLRSLAELAIRHKFYIISDEVYEKLIYDDARHISIASVSEEARDLCITINGFSKTYAMTGWRIGYVAAHKSIISHIGGIQGHMTSATCAISQKAALEAVLGPQDSVEFMRREFEKRRHTLFERLNAMDGISCNNAKGAFYLLTDISNYIGARFKDGIIKNSYDFASFLLKGANVAVVPGGSFNAPDCIRLSYSNSMEKIMEGADRIQTFLKLLN